MKKSVFILLCMLCSSFTFCTAQQLDKQHNMFRSGDVIKKVLCTLTEESTGCKETKLWTIHGKDDEMSVLQKFYQSNDSLRNIYFSERNALNHFSLENNVLKLSVKEDIKHTYVMTCGSQFSCFLFLMATVSVECSTALALSATSYVCAHVAAIRFAQTSWELLLRLMVTRCIT